MPVRPLPRAFTLLTTERNRAVDDALIEALPYVENANRSAVLDLLCKRANPESLATVIGRCSGYQRELQAAVHRRLGEFHAGLRRTIESAVYEERAAAIEAIVAADDDKSAYLLVDALRSRCPRTRELAAGAIQRMTAALVARRDKGIRPEDARNYHARVARLGEMLRAVVQSWDVHLRAKALEVALWMIQSVEPALLEKLSQPRGKIVHALNEILEGASDPRLAGFVVRALSMSDLHAAATSAIARARDPKFIAALIEEAWLLGDTTIEHGCRRIRDAAPIRDWIVGTAGIDARLAMRAIRWIDATGGTREQTLTTLREFSNSGPDELRRAVVWRLVEDETPAATELLTTIAARARDPVAELAARECRRRRLSPAGTIPIASRGTRGDANLPTARAFDRFFEDYDFLASAERQSLSRDLAEAVPDLPLRLAAKLDAADPLVRAAALKIIPALGLAEALADRIYRCARDGDALVRSTALVLLGDLPGPTAQRILRAALNDSDARVQAAAVEVLERIDAKGHAASLRGKLASPDNRVRANAIKALMHVELEEAGAALLEMLGQPSHAHRISALWVIERLGLRNLIERVVELTRNDPDARVRARARRVLRQLAGGSLHATYGDDAAAGGGVA